MSNVQRMQDLYEAFGRGEVPTVLGAMDPASNGAKQKAIHSNPAARPLRGRKLSWRTCS
jgi:hypothetical protein